MGTRADFYVGRGKDAEWLGSIACDGDPSSIPNYIFNAHHVESFRTEISHFIHSREDGTRPTEGWPWPWEDSRTTDYAYAFDEGQVLASCFGHKWFNPTEDETEEMHEGPKIAVFPDMKGKQNVTLGKRSGLIVFLAGSFLAGGAKMKRKPFEEELSNFWANNYIYLTLCSLCGNKGIIDTRGRAISAAGVDSGRKNFCICPNGRIYAKEYASSFMPEFDYGDRTAAHLVSQENLAVTEEQSTIVRDAKIIVKGGCGAMVLEAASWRGTFWRDGEFQPVLITPHGDSTGHPGQFSCIRREKKQEYQMKNFSRAYAAAITILTICSNRRRLS
jgi:hypothetical protein